MEYLNRARHYINTGEVLANPRAGRPNRRQRAKMAQQKKAEKLQQEAEKKKGDWPPPITKIEEDLYMSRRERRAKNKDNPAKDPSQYTVDPPSQDYVIVGHVLKALSELDWPSSSSSADEKSVEKEKRKEDGTEKKKKEKEEEENKENEEPNYEAIDEAALAAWKGKFYFLFFVVFICFVFVIYFLLLEKQSKKTERNHRVRITRRRSKWATKKLAKKYKNEPQSLEFGKRLAKEIIKYEEVHKANIEYAVVLEKAKILQGRLLAKGIIKPPQPKPKQAPKKNNNNSKGKPKPKPQPGQAKKKRNRRKKKPANAGSVVGYWG